MKTEKTTPEDDYLERIRKIASRYQRAKWLLLRLECRESIRGESLTIRKNHLKTIISKLDAAMDQQEIIIEKNGESDG
jgi:hypothetical protein